MSRPPGRTQIVRRSKAGRSRDQTVLAKISEQAVLVADGQFEFEREHEHDEELEATPAEPEFTWRRNTPMWEDEAIRMSLP